MKINIEGSAIIIIDQNLVNDEILNKIKVFNLNYIYNSIGYGIKVVESCYELIKEQAKKYDNESNKLPLIILNEKVDDFLYKKELSKIKIPSEIMIELINESNKYTYIIITSDYTSSFEKDEDGNVLIKENKIIYLSINDFLNLDDLVSFETTSFPKYQKPVTKFNLTDLIYTYLNIMAKSKKELEKIGEDTYQINFKKYKFKILLIKSYKDLYNEELDISDYELIIETDSFNLNKTNILNNEDIIDIYNHIKPGQRFME